VLRKVIDYMMYHSENPAKEIEKPLKSANMTEVVGEWDSRYVEVEQEVLFELILVAYFCLFHLPFLFTIFLFLLIFFILFFLNRYDLIFLILVILIIIIIMKIVKKLIVKPLGLSQSICVSP
jgi:hypothetical protein